MTDLIQHYFPGLSDQQLKQFERAFECYTEWNAKINVVSRKDIENLYERHLLHSLGIVDLLRFKDGSTIMDAGTGGGFPGIPLAIFYPNVHFHLVDSIQKKLTVAHEVASAIGLQNVSIRHCRLEEEKGSFDFVVSRAVMPFPDLAKLCRKNMDKEQRNALPNGLICLKGGDLQHEMRAFRHKSIEINLSDRFKEPFFDTKKVVYAPLL
jgi:16S rRNA (guanine527-N7)-methyltransferase